MHAVNIPPLTFTINVYFCNYEADSDNSIFSQKDRC